MKAHTKTNRKISRHISIKDRWKRINKSIYNVNQETTL